ncbi:MAG: hypothetical protein JWO33_399 [Caulobacteraceae bacterium]|nr:hypothetical protein [Caulobacteraceae bacterium]
MSIRGPGQPGPRVAPVVLAPASSGCEPCDRPPEGAVISDHDARFAVIACHSSRDGFAAITLQDMKTGALIRVQKVPFEHHYGEDFDSQCGRIQAAARQIVQNVADAMAAAHGD